MNLKFAFAVNSQGVFEKQHFGDSDKYLIYEQKDDKMLLVSEVANTFKDMEHGQGNKGDLIADLLKKNDVNVLVSMQFGGNIKIVNKHFIPIVIYTPNSNEISEIIVKHNHWIVDEWNSKSSDYNLFTIKSGVFKEKIKQK